MSVLQFTQILAVEVPKIDKGLLQIIHTLPPSIQEVVLHTFNAGGKRLRPLLTVLCARLFGANEGKIYSFAAALEMLHLASLFHDDVLDNATLRRKKKTAHIVFGTHSAILAGDALLAKACTSVASYHIPELVTLFANAIVHTTEGEIEEFSYQGSLEHNEEKYIEIIRGKTAYLLRTSCEIGAVFAQKYCQKSVTEEEIKALALFGEEIGLAFQLVDDALDFAPESQTGKPQGGDIREGKATPSIFAYYASLNTNEAELFKEKFAGKEQAFTAEEAKKIAQDILKKGLDKVCFNQAEQHFKNALQALEIFQKSPTKTLLIEAVEYLSKRNT